MNGPEQASAGSKPGKASQGKAEAAKEGRKVVSATFVAPVAAERGTTKHVRIETAGGTMSRTEKGDLIIARNDGQTVFVPAANIAYIVEV